MPYRRNAIPCWRLLLRKTTREDISPTDINTIDMNNIVINSADMNNIDMKSQEAIETDSEPSLAVEISYDFLSDISSRDETTESGAATPSTVTGGPLNPAGHAGGISVPAGTLATVNSLSSRAVAGLLRYLTGQRRPPAGSVNVLDCDLGTIGKREIMRLRRRIGIVGGEFDLISELNVSQNLALPCMIRRLGKRQTQMRIERISEALQLGDLLAEPVSHLGAIERRVTLIARALTHDPELMILEAPLSGLDANWSAVIVEHFKRLAVTGSTALLFHEYTGAFSKNLPKP
jgi:ABC-type ATPase involved in cell division